MRESVPDVEGLRFAAAPSWARLSLGVFAVALGGFLSAGLQPPGASSPGNLAGGVDRGGGEAAAARAPVPSGRAALPGDTLVLTGGVPSPERARLLAGSSGSCPAGVVDRLRHVYRWTMDLPDDLRPGDTFRAVLVQGASPPSTTANGSGAGNRLRIVGAEVRTRGRISRAVRYRSPGGSQRGFYEPDGTLVGAGRIPTPHGFRMTSRFSWGRLHPVYRERRPHLGVDYAVPYGEVVRAVAGGIVSEVGRIHGFGLVVQIRHDAHRSTRYAHLSSVAPGIVAGRFVAAGEVVGRAGSSGTATGPHLHFEYLLDGQPRDPLAQRPGEVSRTSPPADLTAFMAQRDRIVEILETRTPPDPTAVTVLVDTRPRQSRSYTGAAMMLAWVDGAGPLPGAGGRGIPRWPLPEGTRVPDVPPEGSGETAATGADDGRKRLQVRPVCALGRAPEHGSHPKPYVITADPAGR